MQSDAESAVRTFLIADLRGYTLFTIEHGDEAAAGLAARFAAIARESVAARGGEVLELRGDEALAVFASPRQALRAAAELQRNLGAAMVEDTSLHLKAGIGLDAGEAVPVDGGFRGAALNLAARLCSLAGSGEVLASEGVIHLARKVEGLVYVDRGSTTLKGFIQPIGVYSVQPETSGNGQDSDSPNLEPQAPTAGTILPLGGYLGSLPSGPLVGRDANLGVLVDAIAEVETGAGRLVLLAGEPGVGKTRLGQEVTVVARDRGFLVAAGRCYEPEQSVAYYPFLDVLSALFRMSPPEIRQQAANQWPYLGALLLDEVGEPDVPAGPDAEQRVLRAVAAFVEAVTRLSPVAILLDDIQWADATSLKLLLHLARHTRHIPLLLLGAYRDVEVGRGHPLEGALRELEREGLALRMAVRRLPVEGTRALIESILSNPEGVTQEFLDLVHERTDGNPFFVQQVLRDLIARGDVFRKDGRWDRKAISELTVPESIRSAVGQRLSKLSEETQEILRDASVLGQSFMFDELQAMGNREETDLERALEEAMASALIQDMDGDRYVFDHALTQQSLYGEITARRKRRLHLAAGEAIEQLPPGKREHRVAELAWHYLQGDDPGRALPYALSAGDEAERVFAHSEAESQYRTALELARETQDRERQREAAEKLGQVLRVTGRYDAALSMLEQAAQLSRAASDAGAEARIAARIGWVHAVRVTPHEGIAELEPTRDRLADAPPSQGLAALHAALAQLYFVTGRVEDLLQSAERAAALARMVGDERTLVQAEGRRAVAFTLLGRAVESRDILLRIIPIAERIGDLETLVRALNNLGDKYLFCGDFSTTRRHLERAVAAARRLGDPDQLAFILGKMAVITWYMGDWPASAVLAEEACAFGRSFPSSWGAIVALGVLGRIHAHMGKLEIAVGELNEALALARRGHDPQYVPLTASFLAECHLLQRRPDAALALLGPLLQCPGLPAGLSMEMAVLAEAYLATGDVAHALSTLEREIPAAQKQEDRLGLVGLLRVQGAVLTVRGRWEEATQAFEQAVSLAQNMPFPWGEGAALYEQGIMLSHRGAANAARRRLEEALVIFRRLGARPHAERAEQAYANLP